MSIQLADKPQELARSAADILAGLAPGHGVAEIEARIMYENEQDVRRTPRPDGPAHRDVVGKPTSVRKVFVRAARWAVPPNEV
jgi:hypothetical protein